MDELGLARSVDLLAKQVHEGVQRVGFDFTVVAPNRFDQELPRDDSSRAVHQPFQKTKFSLRKGDAPLPAHNVSSSGIKTQIRHLQLCAALRSLSPLHGP